MKLELHSNEKVVPMEKAENSVDNLVSFIVHQLRNPVQSINQYLFLIRSEYPSLISANAQLGKDLSMMEEDILRISEILNGLRDSYQIELGGGEELSCATLLEETLTSMNIPEDVEVVSNFEEDLPNIVGSKRLIYVFEELISNAIEAMDGKGIIDISIFHGVDTKMLEIIFWDNGSGVAETHQDHIFDPLVTTRGKGRGFGLFWCKNYLESIQGNIELVSSENPRGTAFKIELKIADEC